MMSFIAPLIACWAVMQSLALARSATARGFDRVTDQSTGPGTSTESIGQSPGRVAGGPWRVGCAAAVVIGVGLLSVPLAAIIVLGYWVRSVARRRDRRRVAAADLVAGIAEVIELFAMVLTSGGTVVAALDAAQTWAPDPYAAEFRWCRRQLQVGRPMSDILEDLPVRIGAPIRPLIAALVAHDRHGAPIIENLIRLAHDARLARRRAAEAAARRLPITLLFPLVVCVLPAFLLLTVIPVVADTFAGFDLSSGT